VGDHLRHRWYATRVAASPSLDLRGVVCETQPPQPRGRTAAEDELVARHFAERADAERAHFGDASTWEALGADVLHVARGATNGPEVFDWVVDRRPEVLLLYGCSIIRPPLLERFDARTVNVHLGLSPYYRGHATNFWPLVNGEPECVGATVHLATLDVDAGAILRQARPRLEPPDGPHDVGCRALAAGVGALLASLEPYRIGALAPQPQRAGGRLYRRRDFDERAEAALRQLHARFAGGMIPDYLAHKAERDARFPIVE
jgi:methionyl-tRNA formyltransferase